MSDDLMMIVSKAKGFYELITVPKQKAVSISQRVWMVKEIDRSKGRVKESVLWLRMARCIVTLS